MTTYKQSDVEALFRRGDFGSWDELLTYLEGRLQHDEQVDNEFSEVESREIVADVRKLRDTHAVQHRPAPRLRNPEEGVNPASARGGRTRCPSTSRT